MEAPTATFAWRRAGCLAGRVRLPMTFAIRVRVDASGSERDRAGNSERGGNQRVREFWREISGARGTFKVPLGPRLVSLETESADPGAGVAEVLAGQAENAKRREATLSAFAGNWCGAIVRGKSESSPSHPLGEPLPYSARCLENQQVTTTARRRTPPLEQPSIAPFGPC